MILLTACNIEQNTIFYEDIFPAVLAAIVALLGIWVQLYVGKRGNNLVIKSITKTKKIESYMQFYRPLNMFLNEITIFFENYMDFDFIREQYHNVDYNQKLKELQDVYDRICKWYKDNYILMYPEDEELDKLILQIYNHMSIILRVTEASPKSWDVLSKYHREDVVSIIDNIKLKIDNIAYE